MSALPRLRFAPSPTGFFHVGGARTALFNWLVARQTGGTFVLRIEDTDTERNREEWTAGIQDAMRWVGVDWDEGPYFQSDRTNLYEEAVERLLSNKRAYYCDCVSDAVRTRNIERFGPKEADRGYDGFCRDRALRDGAVRFRTPDEGTTTVIDLIRGEPTFDNALIEDFIIRRTNGGYMFLLANVVDDIDMRISHVVRGEEHLPNTPKALLLWQALSPEIALPVFAHLPVIVNEKRQKLSKRRDKVALEDFRTQGFVADAMRNFLVTLGWMPPGDVEIIPVENMIELFRLEDVNKSSAFFDTAKLTAFNAEYIRAMSVDQFIEAAEPYVCGDLNPSRGPLPTVTDPSAERIPPDHAVPGGFEPEAVDADVFRSAVPLIQERTKVLTDVPVLVDFLFVEPPIDIDAWNKTMTAPSAAAMLDGVLAGLEDIPWRADSLKVLVEQVGTANELKLGKAQAPIRVALTGRTVGPPLFEAMELLGRERSVRRLSSARSTL